MLLHVELTASREYTYNKKLYLNLPKADGEKCSKFYLKGKSPIDEMGAIIEAQNIAKTLNYDIHDWNFDCEPSSNFFRVMVTSKSKNLNEGELWIEMKKETGQLFLIYKGEKSGLFYGNSHITQEFCWRFFELINRLIEEKQK